MLNPLELPKAVRSRRTSIAFALLAALGAAACGPVSRNERPSEETGAVSSARPTEDAPGDRTFERSPGGTFEVSAEDVRRFLEEPGEEPVRVVDVREPEELVDDLGHIEGVEHVPLAELAAAAEGWDPAAPVVLVCRTGRRSARGVEQLEGLGHRRVASMAGGMLRWKELGFPVSRDPGDVRPLAEPEAPQKRASVSLRAPAGAPPLAIDPAEVRWVRTASLLSTGSEACIDGRDPEAVIGTPGGDAGELLVALATAESFGEPAMDARGADALVDDWVDAFGRFYMHTDVHALEHLREDVLADARFRARGVAPADVAATEALVRHPPPELEGALLELLARPENVGCGHLRAMLVDPADYRVRPGLTAEVLRAAFRHLWRSPEEIDWVVLEGEHHERAIVVVKLEGEVHPYTKVPAIPPSLEGRQTFVAHPQVTAYLREQNASFLLERSPSLARRVEPEAFVRRMQAIADAQLEATVGRLARGLPVYEARFEPPRAPAAR